MATKTTAAKESTEVTTTEAAALPDFLKGYENDNRGSEEVGADDLVIPRIELVQGLSKARKKNDPEYIEGAEEGMFYNNVTRELYGTSIVICPVLFRKEWLLWRDADLGGGFGGAFPDQASADTAMYATEKPEEWEVVDTNQHFVILLKEDGTREEAVISMAKTKAKASRLLNSLVRINGGPRFSRLYTVEGVSDTNKANQEYYTLKVTNKSFVDEGTFNYAQDVYELVKSGQATVDRGTEVADETESEM